MAKPDIAPHRLHCASCGTGRDLHKHHLVPRVLGGMRLPTVMLCIPCHALVHGQKIATNHRELTIEGLRRVKALGTWVSKAGNVCTRLGSHSLSRGFDAGMSQRGREAQTARRMIHAAAVADHIAAARLCGAASLDQIAVLLTKWGIPTPRGSGVWKSNQVRRVIRENDGLPPDHRHNTSS
jgi:hypothetical protein